MTKRIQRRRTKGWRKPEGAVSVGRGTRWGNPYRVSKTAEGVWRLEDPSGRFTNLLTREKAARLAVQWFSEAIANGWNNAPTRDEIRQELSGKDLMCWCPPELPCHADVLLEIANGETQ